MLHFIALLNNDCSPLFGGKCSLISQPHSDLLFLANYVFILWFVNFHKIDNMQNFSNSKRDITSSILILASTRSI